MKKRYIDNLPPEGRTREQVELLKRVFQGMEIVEAKADLIINAKHEDWVGSIPNDLENCVFARSCKRLYDSARMVFLATVAYVDHPDEKGVNKVHRYILSTRMREAIELLDVSKGTKFIAGMFTLLAPTFSNKLDFRRAADAKRRKRPDVRVKKLKADKHRRAIIRAEGRRVIKTKNRAGPLGVMRSGTGLVQTKKVA
jgi:hypothetical protein